jgi:hypothetical protein
LVLVKHNLETHQFSCLDEAMAFAKELGEFVAIQFDGKEVVACGTTARHWRDIFKL